LLLVEYVVGDLALGEEHAVADADAGQSPGLAFGVDGVAVHPKQYRYLLRRQEIGNNILMTSVTASVSRADAIARIRLSEIGIWPFS